MKKVVLATLAFALLPLSSRAQDTPKAGVAVGYSHLQVLRGFTINMNGFSASAAYNVNDWFGALADIGVYHGSPGGVGLTVETYTFGPRFSYRKSDRVVPFAQALFGPSHAPGSLEGLFRLVEPVCIQLRRRS